MTVSAEAYEVHVELPGIFAGEIEIEVEKGLLVIKGEKKERREEKVRDYARSERCYGTFERHLGLPSDAQIGGIGAWTSVGILHIVIPRERKAAAASQEGRKRIVVR